MHEQRGNRRVDAPAQRAEHAGRAHLSPDALDLFLDHGRRSPRGRCAGDVVEEVLQQILAVRRVHDLGMELHAIETPLALLERGDRRRRRHADDLCPRWRGGDGVAVRHPHGLVVGKPGEELRFDGRHRRLAELRDAGALDLASEIERHQLCAVTDAERGNAELEQGRVDVRRVVGIDRSGAAAEDQRVRIPCAHLVGRHAVADELRVDARLTDAPCDQLRVLPTEIQHENGPLLRRAFRQRQHASADSSAPPS